MAESSAPAPEGRIAHERFAPSPALEPFVQHFWTVRWDLRGEPPVLAETLPHPCVHVVFERGRARVLGVQTARRFRRYLRGQDRVFGIKFRPAAFQPFLDGPLSRITDKGLSLRTVFGPESPALRDGIPGEPDPRRCMALAEEFLGKRLPPMPEEVVRLRDLVERLAADPSLTRMEQVAALAGMEPRKLKAVVGRPPAQYVAEARAPSSRDRADDGGDAASGLSQSC